jgi:O-succinylbenzoic acid--CoA ligase
VEIDPWLARATARHPEAVALETPEERLTYRELLMAATRGAARLVGRGAAPGDGVAITLPTGRAFVVAFHACLLLRTPAMPVDPRLGERERKALLRNAEFLVNTPLADDGGAPFNVGEARDDEVALIVHTSGTTRAPRAVELTFGNVAAHIRSVGAVLGSDPGERWLCPMPLSHVGGLMILARSAAGRRPRPRLRPILSGAAPPTRASRSPRPTGSPRRAARSRSPTPATSRPPAARSPAPV